MAAIEINTIQDLIAFSNGDYGRGTSSEYLDVVLTADLDFADLTIDDTAYNWSGCAGTWYVNFDGQGHKVDNIYYSGTEDWGFFGTIYGSVKNLYLPNMFVTSTMAIAGVAAYLRGTLTNVHVSGQIETLDTSNRYQSCGLYFQAQNSKVIGCSVSGLLKSTADSCGIGQNTTSGSSYVSGCLVVADFIVSGTANPFTSINTVVNNCEYIGVAKAGQKVLVGAWDISLFNCILVYKPGTTTDKWTSNSRYYNIYYDSTLAAEGGFTPPSITGATTEELKSATWMHDHGFAI